MAHRTWGNDETEDILRQSSGGFTKDLPYPREAKRAFNAIVPKGLTAGFRRMLEKIVAPYNTGKIGLGPITPLF